MSTPPNKLQPTPIGVVSSAYAAARASVGVQHRTTEQLQRRCNPRTLTIQARKRYLEGPFQQPRLGTLAVRTARQMDYDWQRSGSNSP